MSRLNPNRWEDVRSLVDAEVDKSFPVVSHLACSPESKMAWHLCMAREERPNREAVDNAMLQFSQFQTWQPVTTTQAGLSFLRFDSALLFLDALQGEASEISGLAIPSCDELVPLETVLQFLLIDVWRAVGRAYWLHWISEEDGKCA